MGTKMMTLATRSNLLAVLVMLLSACSGGGGGAGIADTENSNNPGTVPVVEPTNTFDNFQFRQSDSVRANNTLRWTKYINLQMNAALEPLNSIDGLVPRTIPVIYDVCGTENAFYNPQNGTITLCDELVDGLYDYFVGEPQSVTNRVIRALIFVLYHEVGHALVDVLDLPVTGNTESSADAFAVVIASESGRSLAPLFGAFYLSQATSSYGDEHTNGEDRAGDIICWAVGSDSSLIFNSALKDQIDQFIAANRDCVEEYNLQVSSVTATVNGFSSIPVSPVTNPQLLALNDPNPPKQTISETGNLTQTLVNDATREFWFCTASGRTNRVAYKFKPDAKTGTWQELVEGENKVLRFNFEVIGSLAVELTYPTINNLVEKISDFNFTGNDNFEATSDVDGNLVCERKLSA